MGHHIQNKDRGFNHAYIPVGGKGTNYIECQFMYSLQINDYHIMYTRYSFIILKKTIYFITI